MTLDRIEFIVAEAAQAFMDGIPEGHGYTHDDLLRAISRALFAQMEAQQEGSDL